MFQKPDFSPSNSFVIAIIAALLMTIMGAVVAMWYLRTFTQAEVRMGVSEPYHIAYIFNVGPYDRIGGVFEEVAMYLRQANIEPGIPCVLLMDGAGVHESERRSKVGYLISRHVRPPAPLESETLPQRDVVIATFRGGVTTGSYRGYQAMSEWAKKHGYRLSLPALEIYQNDGVTEYQLGISGVADKQP
ncbi:MAG: GyrI-like domain-containing protein [Mariprofundaceae bacterium]|nr:GyrI-like domain-containing protein [Mariprofundaceae bacterium]